MKFRKRRLAIRNRALAVVALIGFGLCVTARPQDNVQQIFDNATGLLDQSKFPEAAAGFTRCLAANPKFAKCLFNRAIANEMVDRAKALEDWESFVEVAGDSQSYKWDIGRARARIQLLKSMPELPPGLLPSRYDAVAGDYYRQVAEVSDGLQWRQFPVNVYLGSAPEIKWQQGTREAFDIWSAVVPLKLVVDPARADVRIGWQESVEESGHVGEETDWVRYERMGDQLSPRRVAIITVDLSRRWNKDEMRAIMSHEFGHALGIKGHSESKKDIMYWQMQESYRNIPAPILPTPIFWRSLVKDPSARDVNTLIRLYNSAGYIRPLR